MPYKSTSFKDKKSQYRLNSCTVIMIANNSNKVLGVTKRSVGTANVNIWSMLHKSLVRPILEQAAPVWSPYLAKDIHLLECVRRSVENDPKPK